MAQERKAVDGLDREDRSAGRRVRDVGCTADTHDDRINPDIDLLCPLTIRGVTTRNRIAVSPMCQYLARDGYADDWHFVHLGSRAVGGAGVVFTEATAIVPEGRISSGDLGLWDDRHIEPLARIVRFVNRMGTIAGIQLAHAGRKGSCVPPWEGGARLSEGRGGWPVVAPSPIPFAEGEPPPRPLDERGIRDVIAAFAAAARRALTAGFQIVEIHAAHGYLLHEFLSPLSNHREDRYGGSLENRMRLVLEVAEALRSVLPGDRTLFVRISATDWVEGGWDLDQSIVLARELGARGVDLIDASSGALVPRAHIPVQRNYQVPFAAAIREHAGILTGAVGLITEAEQADEIITSGAADLVLVARELLREPDWPLKVQQQLGQEPDWPIAYGYAIKRPKR